MNVRPMMVFLDTLWQISPFLYKLSNKEYYYTVWLFYYYCYYYYKTALKQNRVTLLIGTPLPNGSIILFYFIWKFLTYFFFHQKSCCFFTITYWNFTDYHLIQVVILIFLTQMILDYHRFHFDNEKQSDYLYDFIYVESVMLSEPRAWDDAQNVLWVIQQ